MDAAPQRSLAEPSIAAVWARYVVVARVQNQFMSSVLKYTHPGKFWSTRLYSTQTLPGWAYGVHGEGPVLALEYISVNGYAYMRTRLDEMPYLEVLGVLRIVRGYL